MCERRDEPRRNASEWFQQYGAPRSKCEGRRGTSVRLSRSEERVRRLAVIGRLGMMCPDPRDLGFKQRDPRHQLVLRIGVEIFLRQLAGGVAAHAGKIVVVHGSGASQRAPLAVNTPSH